MPLGRLLRNDKAVLSLRQALEKLLAAPVDPSLPGDTV